MRRNYVIISLVAIMLVSWSVSTTTVSSYNTAVVAPRLSWDVKANDQFAYILNSSMTVTADTNAWSMIDDFMVHTMNYSSGFNSQSLLNSFLSKWPVNVGVRLTIKAITGEYVNDSYYYYIDSNHTNKIVEYYYRDIINVSLELKQSTDTAWGTPNQFLANLAEAYMAFTAQIENVSLTDSYYLSSVGSMKTAILSADFSNFPLLTWISGAYSNDSYPYFPYMEPDPYTFFGYSDAALPTYPMDAHMATPIAWMILPHGYDFTKMWNWMKSAYALNFNYELGHGYTGAVNEGFTDDFAAVLNSTGTKVVVQPRAFCIAQKFSLMKQTLPWYNWMLGNLTSYYGLGIIDENFYTGMECENATGVLNTWATYFDASFVLNLTMINPSFVNKHIGLSGFFTYTRNNTTPIKLTDLQNGIIGTLRTGNSGGIFDLFGSIPGYPFELLCIVGIFATLGIIRKARKVNHK